MSEPLIRADLWTLVEADIDRGDFDEGVSKAFRHVETLIQSESGSNSIGAPLVDGTFGTKIVISRDPRDEESVKNLFKGSIGFFKGSRSHGARPPIRIASREHCLRIVALASVLLDLLDNDESHRPDLESYRQLGDLVEFQVRNVRPETLCLIDGAEARIVSRQQSVLAIDASGSALGPHQALLRTGSVEGAEFTFQVVGSQPLNWHRVLRADVTLYSDAAARNQREQVGVLLESYEGGRYVRQCFPTRETYEAGSYVAWEWDRAPGVGESWIKDDSGQVVSAWLSAAFFKGHSTRPPHGPTPIGLRLFPEHRSKLGVGEAIPIVVQQQISDGIGHWEETVTAPVLSSNERVVHVDRRSVMRAKMVGSADLSVQLGEHFARSVIEVQGLKSGAVLKFLGSIPHVDGVAYSDEYGIFVTNQSSIVHQVTTDGDLKVLTDVGRPYLHPHGLEKIVATQSGSLFARSVGSPTIIVIDLSRPERHRELTLGEDRSPVSICCTGDEVFVTDHMGRIWALEDDRLQPFCDVVDNLNPGFTLTHLAASDERLWVLDNMTGLYSIDRSTKAVSVSAHRGSQNQFSDILFRNGLLYVSDFHGGRIAR